MEDQISLLEKKCSLLRVKNKQRNKKASNGNNRESLLCQVSADIFLHKSLRIRK